MAEYPKMKKSELPWVGNIPTHWKTTRMKYLLQNVSEKNHPDAMVLSLYREYGILPKDSRDDNHNVTSLDTGSYKFVCKGELVINKMKAWQGSLGISDYEGIVSPAYYVCHFTSDEVDRKYFHYLVRCKAYAQEFERLSTGMRVGQWDLGIDDFMCISALIPPLSEQASIAAYLYDQCSKIDALIAEAKDSIEEYKQWKASIIFEAVTKGLSPNVKMKSSGIEWIKEMPADWKIKKIKYVAETQTKRSENNANYIGLENVESGSGKIVSGKSNEFSAESSSISINEGDVVFGKLRPYLAKCTVVKESGCCSTEFIVLRPMSIDANFLKYSMLSPKFVDAVNMSTYGAKMPRANWTFIGDMKISLPSISVQREIAEYLDEKGYIIDLLIYKKQNLVADFELYKKSLIYETVTGKRKVV